MGIKTLAPDTAVLGLSSAAMGVDAVRGNLYQSGASSYYAYAFAQAQNSNWPCSGSCSVAAATEGYNSDGSYLSNAKVNVATLPFWKATNGLVQFFALAQNGGSVSFEFRLVPFPPPPPSPPTPHVQVPEAPSVILLGVGLSALSVSS